MSVNELYFIKQVEKRICELQNGHVALQEQLKTCQTNMERNLNNSALKIIDIIDMLETTKSNIDLNNTTNTDFHPIIKKVEKRLLDILKYWQIEEIVFRDKQIEIGKARVIETRESSGEVPAGSIIEVCRKGYKCGNKVVRPADVITAGKNV